MAMNRLKELIEAQHADMYSHLQRMKDSGSFPELDPANIPGIGVRVKITSHGWVVLVRTFFNWRILDCRNHPLEGVPNELSGWLRGWCYAGPSSSLTALLSAVTWSGDPDTEPSGWVKSLPDERRHGEPQDGIRQE